MTNRLAYTYKLLSSGVAVPKFLVLLTGRRKVTVGVDGTIEVLTQIAKKNNIDNVSELTETHLMQEAYAQSEIQKKYGDKLQIKVIDTQEAILTNGEKMRPTTGTTMLNLIKWLGQHPEISKITFVSNQPHVQYQRTIVEAVFGDNSNMYYEVVGGTATANNQSPIYLVGALGAYIWAKTPHVMSVTGLKIEDKAAQKQFTELYERQATLYKRIQERFIDRVTDTISQIKQY
jgi:hypothetical protein